LAIRDLSQAIAIDTRCALAFFNRAVCYHFSKQPQKVYQYENNVMGTYSLQLIAMQALKDYGIVVLLGDQLSLKVLINRGLLYSDLNDYTNALLDFLLAVNICPLDKQIHHTLGLCYHK
jgi:tetratricopeptide (TPR) repeat protein